jgi:LuxR family quorum sensing-dependent transcriptional regulator
MNFIISQMRAIDDAIEAFERAQDLPALGEALQDAIERFGFASFEFVEISDLGPKTPFHFGTSGRWRDIYVANGFRLIDPSLARARTVATPFDSRSVPLSGSRTRQILRMFEAAADLGLTDGFFCPHHMRDADDRLRSHACALLWAGDARSFRQNLAENRHALHLITMHFMERAMTLRGLREPSPAIAVEDLEITLREREILGLAAKGKTSAEIAEVLQISSLTAQTHMKNAIRKMQASNRTHAVSLAIARGLVRL